MTLWKKDKAALDSIARFTIGKDAEMDQYLAKYDVLGSLAHITGL